MKRRDIILLSGFICLIAPAATQILEEGATVEERIENSLVALLFIGIGCFVFAFERRHRRLQQKLQSVPDSVAQGNIPTAIHELEELQTRSPDWEDALAIRVAAACIHKHPELAHALLDHFDTPVDELWYKEPRELLNIDEMAECHQLPRLKAFAAKRRLREAQAPSPPPPTFP